MTSLPGVMVRPRASLARRPPSFTGSESWEFITRGTAVLVTFLLGTGIEIRNGLTLAGALSVALVPVWARNARQRAGAGTLAFLTAACLVAGPVLTAWSSVDHARVHAGTSTALLILLCAAAGTGALLWASDELSPPLTAAVYAVGVLATATRSERFAESHWRFGFGYPTVVLSLAVCLLIGNLALEVVAVVILALITAESGARSMSAFLIMALVLVIWAHRPRLSRRSASVAMSLLLVVGLGFGIYKSLEAAALEGYLGSYAQERTQQQIEQSGSLLLGGRPEIGALAALMHARPLGYGTGTAPSPHDIMIAKSGMSSLGYDPNNGYVEHYMMGARIEVHSLLGDLWVYFGLTGAAAAIWLLVLAVRYIGRSLATHTATALGLFLSVNLCWDVFFGPIFSALQHIDLTLALVLLPLGSRLAEAAGGSPRRARHGRDDRRRRIRFQGRRRRCDGRGTVRAPRRS